MQALRLLAVLIPAAMPANSPQVTVEDTGSTNRPGLRVIFDREGHATVEPRGGETQHIRLPEHLCKRILHDVESAGRLNELPSVHCMKSISFGASTFLEFEGGRSPDLSCPAGDDSRTKTLREDANEILQAVREAANIPAGRVFTAPAPHAR